MARINIRKMQVNQEGTIASVKVGGGLGRRLRDNGAGDRNQDTGPGSAFHPAACVKGFTLTF